MLDAQDMLISKGYSAQVMSDWLADKKLDRKLLGMLAANLAAVEAWDDYEADETLAVLEDLVADVAGEPREAAVPLNVQDVSNDEVAFALLIHQQTHSSQLQPEEAVKNLRRVLYPFALTGTIYTNS